MSLYKPQGWKRGKKLVAYSPEFMVNITHFTCVYTNVYAENHNKRKFHFNSCLTITFLHQFLNEYSVLFLNVV